MTSPDEGRHRFDCIEQFEDAAFRPSRTIERLILQVLGGWSQLVEQVRWLRFHNAGFENKDEVVHPNADQLGKTLKTFARDADIRFPGAEVQATATMIREVRNDLAHMIYLEEIEGEAPERRVSYVRVEGLDFRDEVWSAQTRRRVIVTETKLRKALAATEWADAVLGLAAADRSNFQRVSRRCRGARGPRLLPVVVRRLGRPEDGRA